MNGYQTQGQPQYAPNQPNMMNYGSSAADPAGWVPPPGWVAPPGWLEYQQFLAAQMLQQQQQQQQPQSQQQQQRTSANYGYPPIPYGYMPYPVPNGADPNAAGGAMGANGQPMHPAMYMGYPPPYGYHPNMFAQQPPASSSSNRASANLSGGIPQYPPYPYYPGVPYPGAQPGEQQQQHMPQVYPTQQVSAQAPAPRPSPKNQTQNQQQRPPPPGEPATTKAPRVRVAFDDADSDDERLARHDTLGNFDLDDVHEISDHDFAELDDGNEQGVQDAGIMEGEIPVQPAIALKDTMSRESTTIPVQSIAVDASVGGSFISTLKEQPVPAEEPELYESNQTLASGEETPSASNSPSRRNSGTPQKRRSTFGALLGAAAAAVFGGSSRKLETQSSKKGSQLNNTASVSETTMTAETTQTTDEPRPFSTIAEEESRPSIDIQSISAEPPAPAAEKVEYFQLGGSVRQLESSPSSQSIPVVPPSRQSSLQKEEQQKETKASNLAAAVASLTLVGAAAAAGAATALDQSSSTTSSTSTVAGAGAAAATTMSESSKQQSALQRPEEAAGATAGGAGATAGAPEDDEFVSIKVRTLAGKAAIFEVDKTMTLFEFRDLIHSHFTNIPVEEQRLLYKGKMIEVLEPATTLDEIGFKTNDLVHLVRTLANKQAGANSPEKLPSTTNTNSSVSLNSSMDDQNHLQQVQPQSAGPNSQLQMLTVLVPPGRGPGDRLRILPQGRGAMLVTVPAGVFAGDRFRVLLPPEDPVEMQRATQLMQIEQQRQQELLRQAEIQRQQQQQKPQIMAVVVPKGFKAGQVMDVTIPGRGRVRVTIPNGVKAGQQFKFRLPN